MAPWPDVRARRRIAAWSAAVVAASCALAGCSAPAAPGPATSVASPSATASSTPPAPASTPPASTAAREAPNSPEPSEQASASCPLPQTGFDCDLQRRIVAADAYARSRPGTTGFVVRDRQTGAVYRNGFAGTAVWTASTIKLAMTIALERWNDAGTIRLSTSNRNDIAAMLHSSDDDAADRLWYEYADTGLTPGAAPHTAYNAVFASFGMTHLQPQSGFSKYQPYWGFQECTPADLDALDQYLLTEVPAAERADIVTALQHVDPDQQWGVWGAGASAVPGNKDGWSQEASGWVMNSVGFVGPGQRYTLAMMNSLNGEGGYDTGRATVTQVAATLFAGRF